MNDTLEQTKELDRLKRALIALEKMQARLDQVEYAKTEPIAIIGMGCRFPGGADNPEIFWQLLCDGGDAIREVPPDRWDVDAYYDPDPDAVGKMSIKYGGFIDRIDQFDPQFFGMSPREAVTLDPQQRLLLEVSWETLENGGFVPEQLMGTQTGVFIGISNIDYVLLTSADPAKIDAYMSTGSGHSTAAGRLSYFLGLRGPAIAMDTACSSSLVAIHLACQSLRAKECHLALAGGTNALLSPEFMMNFSKARMLSPDGRCKTFDASANGYVRSEGCGMIILKRLSDALKDNDHILALIRGSAINHDGRTSGLTVPNGPSQQAVIRKALENAGLEPNQVGYIEAHGTGTALGDPIELGALQKVFGKDRAQDNPLIVGSVKTNMGHLESAAGIVGLMKAVLALHQKKIPPHLHFNEPNPKFEWETFPAIRVPTQPTSWPLDGRTRIAGVSSFGFSGTNVHVVLEEAPVKASKQKAEDRRQKTEGRRQKAEGRRQDLVDSPQLPALNPQEAVEERPLHLLTLSAKTGEALNHLAERYEKYVATHPDVAIGDVCFTANTCRTQFQHRLAVLGTSGLQICEKLTAFNDGQEGPGLCQGYVKNGEAPKIAFLFTGQGSQYVGMGRQLYETQPLFRQILDQCDEILCSYLEIPLLKVLYPTSINTQPFDKLRTAQSTIIDQTAYTQPAIFVLEYALAKLWLSWGIQPAVVLGHSVGEYAAACIAGVFSLEDGLKLIVTRGQLMQTHCNTGDMLAVRLDEARVVEAIQPYASDISIAAINGPESIVLSGEHEAIRSCKADLESREIKTRQLSVSHAFHSPLMEPILPHFEQIAREVVYSPPTIKFCSNLHAQFVTDEIVSPEYWCRHVRQPVRFADGMARLFEQDYEVFLEIGPKPILLGMGRQIREDSIQYSVFSKQEVEKPTPRPFQEGRESDNAALRGGKHAERQSTTNPSTGSGHRNHQSEILWLPSLRSGQRDWQQLLQTLGELYVNGVLIDWSGFDQEYSRRKVVLPTYPFQRQRYWIETSPSRSIRHITSNIQQHAHPLLGQRRHSAALKNDEVVFESLLGPDSETFLSHHRVFGTAILPAAGFLEMGLAAGRKTFHSDHLLIEDFIIHQALVFPEHSSKTVQIILIPEDTSAYSFQIFSLAGDDDAPDWTCHASGKVIRTQAQPEAQPAALPDLSSIRAQCIEEISISDFYQLHVKRGIEHGSSFRAIEELRRSSNGDVIAQIQLPESQSSEFSDFSLHPVLLDACFQVLGAIFPAEDTVDINETRLPVGLERLSMYRSPSDRLWCIVQPRPADEAELQNWLADLYLFTTAGELIARVEGMKSQKVRRETLSAILQTSSQKHDWLYNVVWQPLTLPSENLSNSDTLTPAEQWLIFADDQGIGEQLGQGLQELNTAYSLVFPGNVYERTNEHTFRIDPANPTDFQHLISESTGENQHLETYIVHLWSLYGRLGESQNIPDLEMTQMYGCGSVLHLIQMLGKAELLKPPSLCLVTQGAMPVAGQNPNVVQSPLWGLGNVIAAEHPELHCVRIDLDPYIRGDEAQILLEEIRSQTKEDQIAFRENVRYGARLVRLENKEFKIKKHEELKPSFRSESTYLITGGLGALGLLVAQWMVAKQGVKYLVLAGRSPAKGEVNDQLQRLRESGAEVVVSQTDVSDTAQVSKLLEEISQIGPSLRGIIHAAGLLDDGILASQNWGRFKKVLAPKVLGAWNLHKLTEHLPLDFFILFSSAASLLWSPAQANYVAANVFLDTLAHYRRSCGLTGMSINWGVWSEIGVAAKKQADQKMKTRGVRSISPQQGLQFLDQLFLQSPVQVGVVPIDWSQFLTVPWASSPFFTYVKHTSALTPSTRKTEFMEQLAVLPVSEQKERLSTHIQSQLAQVLILPPSQQLDPQQGFFDIGMDSLTSIELKNRLQTSLKCSLSPTIILKYSTLEALTNYLYKEVLGLETTEHIDRTSAGQAETSETLKNVKQMSEKELEELINQEFDALVQEDTTS